MTAPTPAPMSSSAAHAVLSRRRALALGLLLATAGGAVRARGLPPELAADLPGAVLRGSGRLTFLLMHVYDIRLWSIAPLPADDYAGTPLALEIAYARALKGRLIAERSVEEMRRIGTVNDAQATRWLAAMTDAFPDVKAGDRITGVHRPGDSARFFVNGERSGEVRDADFARLFFGIWLSPRTSEPELRLALLGGGRAGGGT